MASRIGGIVTVLTSGIVLELGGNDPQAFFFILVGVMLTFVMASVVIDRHIPREERFR